MISLNRINKRVPNGWHNVFPLDAFPDLDIWLFVWRLCQSLGDFGNFGQLLGDFISTLGWTLYHTDLGTGTIWFCTWKQDVVCDVAQFLRQFVTSIFDRFATSFSTDLRRRFSTDFRISFQWGSEVVLSTILWRRFRQICDVVGVDFQQLWT